MKTKPLPFSGEQAILHIPYFNKNNTLPSIAYRSKLEQYALLYSAYKRVSCMPKRRPEQK
jgi:hypothetical protein